MTITLLYTHLSTWQHAFDVCLSCLPAAEQAHAAQLRQSQAAQQYIVARYILRQRLAAMLAQPAAQMIIDIEPYGKPYLADPPNHHFSIAHSGEWVLVGLAGSPLGVDVEAVPTAWDWQPLAAHYFTATEQHWLNAQPTAAQAFTQIWVTKEACLKCSGLGLAGLATGLAQLQPQAGRLVCAGFACCELRLLAVGVWAAVVCRETQLINWEWVQPTVLSNLC